MSHSTESLERFLADYDKIAVITGAGVSTGSGIPDYRDHNGDRKGARPIQFRDFMEDPHARRRYWARSYTGWKRFAAAEPNAAHRALTLLERAGKTETLITQNVDQLHSRAGSRSVIDLHGRLNRVRCMDCEVRQPRDAHQARLCAANPDWEAEATVLKPDGDVEITESAETDFEVPGCPLCGGILKPDVVMFGENVPRERVREATAVIERAAALLVVGSSLTVFSGFRFVRQAHARGIPIAILNQGRTRADELATLRIEADCTRMLPKAATGQVHRYHARKQAPIHS